MRPHQGAFVDSGIFLVAVALWILALTVPGIPAHIGQISFCLPAEDCLALGRVRIAGGDITGAAGRDLAGKLQSGVGADIAGIAGYQVNPPDLHRK